MKQIDNLRDLKKFYLIKIIITIGLNLNNAIFFLYPGTFGLNFMEMMFVYFSITQIIGFIFNIPTGIIADKYSVRFCIIIGYLFYSITYILRGTLPFMIEPFFAFIISEIIMGIGNSFLTGSTDKYLYNFKDKISDSKIFSWMNTISFWTRACSTLLGGFILIYFSMAWTQIFGGIILFGGFLLSYIYIIEPIIEKTKKSSYNLLELGLKYSLNNKKVFVLILGGAFIGLAIAGSRNVFQPLLSKIGLNINTYSRIFSLIFTLQMIFSGFGAYLTPKIEKKINLNILIIITIISLAMILLIMTTTSKIIFIGIFIIIFGLFEGALYPQYAILMNRAITNEEIRATVLSIDYFFSSFVLGFTISFIGYLTDNYGININLYISSLLFIIGAITINSIYFKKIIIYKKIS